MQKNKISFANIQGFTLIELLIVIAVMAILTTVVFVALNPLARFQDSRNSRRWSDVNAMLGAIKLDQVDNGGSYLPSITAVSAGANYIIGANGSSKNCSTLVCGVVVAGCVNIAPLVTEGYLPKMPFDPNDAEVEEADGDINISKYYLRVEANSAVTIGACSSEKGSAPAAPTIEVTR